MHLSLKKLAKAVAINQSKRLGVTSAIHWATGSRHRGGDAWSDRGLRAHVGHVLEVFDSVAPHVGKLEGKVGVELGPGDDIGVAYCFLKSGAKKMYTIERFDSMRLDARARQLFEAIDERMPTLSGLRTADVLRASDGSYVLERSLLDHRVGLFEQTSFDEPIDFAYSNDVMEHVDDPSTVYQAAQRVLRPGGLFVNNIDLSGHNAYCNPSRPLDFLSCPDWLWPIMSSHIVTTNRVRYGEFLAIARRAGFDIEKEDVLRKADAAYVREVRPTLLDRYRHLSDEDLAVVQVMLVTRRREQLADAASSAQRPAAKPVAEAAAPAIAWVAGEQRASAGGPAASAAEGAADVSES